MVGSTHEFLSIVRTSPSRGILASLDVESLFTNVPVNDTIDIILSNVYEHSTLPPPAIPKLCMK
jgi:hypothetical protein